MDRHLPLTAACLLAACAPAASAPAAELGSARSPFLREHAADAIAWLPWAEASLVRAREAGRPLLLVIGRAPSDRCRLRLGEVLADAALLAALQERFVPVLADRDERPDLADAAALALGLLDVSETGLPTALVLTPDARPFAGLSLAAPAAADRLRSLLARAAGDWAARPGEVEARAGVVLLALRQAQAPASAPLAREMVDRARRGLAESYDAKRGGFGVAPKSIPHGALRLLLAEHERRGDAQALRLATETLEAVARGALRDGRTGAFHAQALDDGWRVAVSETTLADNALLLRALVLAYRATARPLFRDTALGIAGWAVRSMRQPSGAFEAATWLDEAKAEARDPRVFAGANGLMIGALAAAGSGLGRPGDLEAARGAATAVLASLGPAASLRRYALGGEAGGAGLLEDHAYLSEGLLDLAEATRDDRWRREAQALADAALARFSDPQSAGLFDTDDGHGLLLVRTRSGFDGALPSANGVMASVLRRLAIAGGESRYADLGRRNVEAFGADLRQAPRGMETMAEAAAEILGAPRAVAAAEPALASREVRGAVTLETAVVPGQARAGSAVEGRVRLVVAGGWYVNAHRPGPKDLLGLTVTAPGENVAAAPALYPAPTSRTRRFSADTVAIHTGEALVTVPLRVPSGARPGARRLRFRIGFQACQEDACRPPESVVLEAPFEVAP